MRYLSYYEEIGLRSRRRGFPRLQKKSNCEARVETEGYTHPWIEGAKESHALPFDVSSRKLRGRLSGKALPHFFIPGLLLLLLELLSHVWLSCDSMDCTPPGSFVHGIFQGRILGWVAISSSRGSSYAGTESASPAAPVSQADPFLLSHQGSPISGLREVRSSLQSIATSPEKGGVW